MKSWQFRYRGFFFVVILGVALPMGCRQETQDPDDDLIANEPKTEASNNSSPNANPAPSANGNPAASPQGVAATPDKDVADEQGPIEEQSICWPFDEREGKDISDSTKNPIYRGIVCGEETWTTPGKVGRSALNFDGETTYVVLKNTVVLNVANQITIAAWIKPDKVGDFQNIVVQEDLSPNSANEMFLRILGGQYHVGIWHGGDIEVTFDVPPEDNGVWVHLAGVYDGKCWYLYRNGELVAARKIDLKKMKPFHFSGPWTVGGTRRADGGRYFKGQINDVRLCNRGLTQAEIAKLAGQAPAAAAAEAKTSPTEEKH